MLNIKKMNISAIEEIHNPTMPQINPTLASLSTYLY